MFVIAQNVRGQFANISASAYRLGANFGECKMKSILDHKFHYTSSVETDVKKTFARVRREICRLEQAKSAANAEASKKVLQITTRHTTPRTGII